MASILHQVRLDYLADICCSSMLHLNRSTVPNRLYLAGCSYRLPVLGKYYHFAINIGGAGETGMSMNYETFSKCLPGSVDHIRCIVFAHPTDLF